MALGLFRWFSEHAYACPAEDRKKRKTEAGHSNGASSWRYCLHLRTFFACKTSGAFLNEFPVGLFAF